MGIIFQEDFTKPNAGWYNQQTFSLNRLIAQTAVTRYTGEAALQVSVRPGDCPVSGLTTERNEFLQMLNNQDNDVNGLTPPEVYQVSLYLPKEWQDTKPDKAHPVPWCTPFQLHGPDTYGISPAFQLDLCAVPGRFTLFCRGRDVSAPVVRQFDLGEHRYSQWSDFRFKINWKANSTGSVQVWRRDNKIGDLIQVLSTYTPTLYSHSGTACLHYWKSGCYRNPAAFTTMFYRSRLIRATTLQEVENLTFGGG